MTNEGVYTIVNADELYFASEVVTPDQAGTRTNGPSPREQPRYLLRWHSSGLLSPHNPSFDPGERVRAGNVVYELVSAPRQIGVVPPTDGQFEAEIVPVEELYPLVGDLEEMDGTLILADVRFSAYSNNETHADQGTYEDFDGESPLEYLGSLKMNRQLASGTSTFKVVSAETDNEGNFIRLELRRAGG